MRRSEKKPRGHFRALRASGRNTLIATSWRNSSSERTARKTCPMPPRPRVSMITYGPIAGLSQWLGGGFESWK